jgi:catabolite regulation protein CreA
MTIRRLARAARFAAAFALAGTLAVVSVLPARAAVTVPEKGGLKGWIGVAEEVSDISLACRQIGPIRFKKKFAQGEDVFSARRSLFFKKMQIVRGCDTKRNVLVYMVYSDKLIDGSPKNSTSTVPVMPWDRPIMIRLRRRSLNETES